MPASNTSGASAQVRLHDPRGEEPVAHQLGLAQPGRAGEVVDAVVRHRDGDAGVGVLEAGLVRRVVGRDRGQRREVAAGGAAGDREVVGVAAVLRDVLADPRDRALHVDDLGGERVARGEPVVDRHADPALGGEVLHQRDALLVLVADRPAAAVDLEQHRGRPVAGAGGRPVDVEQAALAVLGGVGDVLLDHHVGVAHPERVDQPAPRRRQVGRGGQGVELLEVVGADALDERVLGVLLHPAGLVEQEGLAGEVERPPAASPARLRRPRRSSVARRCRPR